MRQRGQLARAAQLPGDVLQARDGLLRGELIGQRPARKLVGIAHGVPQGEGGDLDHRAVDQEVERLAPGFDLAHGLHRFLDGRRVAQVGRDLEAVFAQKVDHLRLVGKGAPLNVADLIEEGVEPARGRDLRVQIAQRAGGCVAGVFERFVLRAVVCLQCGQAHDPLALHLH